MWQCRYTYDAVFCNENYIDAMLNYKGKGSPACQLSDSCFHFCFDRANLIETRTSEQAKVGHIITHAVICHDYRIYSRLDYYMSNQELSKPVRLMILNKILPATKAQGIHIQLDSTTILPLIMSWYKRIWHLTMREHLISYTSTYYSVLGGAYCSLGKQNTTYAYKAGVLAIQQIKLAKKLKDPILEYKCWLYFAEDLIQINQIEKAEKILMVQKDVLQKNKDYYDPTHTLNSMMASVKIKLDTQKTKTTKQSQPKRMLQFREP